MRGPLLLLAYLVVSLVPPCLPLNPLSPVISTNVASMAPGCSPLPSMTPLSGLHVQKTLEAMVHNTTGTAAFVDLNSYRLTGKSRNRAVKVYGYMPLSFLPTGFTLQNRAVRKSSDKVLKNGDIMTVTVLSNACGRVTVCPSSETARVQESIRTRKRESRAWRRRPKMKDLKVNSTRTGKVVQAKPTYCLLDIGTKSYAVLHLSGCQTFYGKDFVESFEFGLGDEVEVKLVKIEGDKAEAELTGIFNGDDDDRDELTQTPPTMGILLEVETEGGGEEEYNDYEDEDDELEDKFGF